MASLVDRMVTEYVLDSRGYSAGTQNVVHDSHRAGQAIDQAKAKTHGFGVSLGGFMNGIAGVLRTAAMALGAAGGAVAGLGIYAMKTAADFDTLERTLTAVTGSAERAKAILAFVDELAVPSVFGSAQLADAAKTLEAFGLQTERYLPVVEKLGTVFGGSAEKLDQFVRALGYIKGGRFGEAFEALAAAGISRQMITGAGGGQFDASGEFLGSVDSALSAVEKLVQDKYGKLADEMASGPTARLASAWDNIQRGVRQAGQELLKGFLPYVDLVSDKISTWVKDGTFAEWGKKIADLFAPTGPIVGGILTFAAYVAELPDAWEILKHGMIDVANVIVRMTNHIIGFYNRFADLANLIATVGESIGLGGGIGNILPKMDTIDELDNPMPTGKFDPSGVAKGWQDSLTEAYNRARDKANAKKSSGSASTVADQGAAAIQEVASNTAELVAIGKRQLQLQEGALGGGSVGRVGIAAREMVDIRRRSRPAMVPG